MKVAISQRIIPHYRIPVFENLSKRSNIELTVFYGRGFPSGSQANADDINSFKARQLPTLFLNYKKSGSKQLRVWHPTLLFHLMYGGFDVVIVEPSTNFYNDIFVYLYCKLMKKKFIWYDSGSIPFNERPIFRKLIEPFLSLFIKGADACLTYTSYADKSLIRDYNISKDIIFRAQNTIDIEKIYTERFRFENQVELFKRENQLSGYFLTLYMGGLEKRKNINLLISATSNLNELGLKAKTMIVGDGPDYKYIFDRMTNKESDRTIYFGKHIEDATLYLLASDVVVLPSGGGLSVLQALSCSSPFIGSEEIEYGGIKDYIKHGYNGFLVKENDLYDLQNSLFVLLSNKDKLAKMKSNAYKSSKEFTVTNMVDGIENAIKYTMRDKSTEFNHE
jgi:glycosyltransferase involved in cell wall biosynthesis